MTATAFQPRRRTSDADVPPPTPRRRPLSRLVTRLGRVEAATVRAALATLLCVGLAIVAGNVFDRFEPILLIPVAVALLAVIAAARLPGRVPKLLRVVLVAVAIWASAATVAVLVGGTISDVVVRLADGPRRLLTTEWPSPRDPTAVATIAWFLGAATAVSVALARWSRLHLAPLAAPTVALVVLLALSAPHPPAWWLTVALGVTAVAFALARHGERPVRRLSALRGERAVAVAVLALALGGVATASAVAWTGRADPRQVTAPERSMSLLHPLEAVVAMRSAEPPIAMFTVTDESALIGQPMPTRWRTAALDAYDGQRWVPTAAVRPIGASLGRPTPPHVGRPPAVRYRIELLTDDTDLVPLPGKPLDLVTDPGLDIETDVGRVVVKLVEPAPAGTRLQLVAERTPSVGEVVPAVVLSRPVDEYSRAFADTAEALAGTGDPIDRLLRLEQAMKSWDRDQNAPGGGQQLRLLQTFVTAQEPRGTDEQFTAAFVLLARSLGYDARVATGFVVPADAAETPLTVTSAHAAAWPEVQLADVGWMAFNPLPERVSGDEQPPPPENQTLAPAAAQPPIEPPTEGGPTDDTDDTDDVVGDSAWGVGRWISRVVLLISAIAVPLCLLTGSILFVKYFRRRRRATVADSAAAVRGAWANVTDLLVDAGLDIEEAWTDDRIAAMGSPLVGSAPPELHRLAAMATAATFGPPPGPIERDDAAAVESRLSAAIAGQLSTWQRVRWHLSLRSLRPSTRSPVVP